MEFLKELRQTYPKFAMMLDNAGHHKSLTASQFIEGDRRGRQADLSAPARPAAEPDRGAVYGAQAPAGAARYFESVDELRDTITQNEMKPVEINGYVT